MNQIKSNSQAQIEINDHAELQNLNDKMRESHNDLKQITDRSGTNKPKDSKFELVQKKVNREKILRNINQNTDVMETIRKITGKTPRVVSYNQDEILDENEIAVTEKSNSILIAS